jgi:predicted dehydrogenase
MRMSMPSFFARRSSITRNRSLLLRGRGVTYFARSRCVEIRDRDHPENSTGWDVTSAHREKAPTTTFYAPYPAVRDNLEAFGRAALAKAPYPVTLDEMLANVRSFEAIQRSVKSGAIEMI